MKTLPWIGISSKLSPLSDSRPRPPLLASRYRLSVIGAPPLRIEPDTCTELALSASTLAPATISAGVLRATPLPSEELPQPVISAATRMSPSSRPGGKKRRGHIAAQTLDGGLVGYGTIRRRLGYRAIMDA